MTEPNDIPLVSIVTPVYNEEANLQEFYRELAEVLEKFEGKLTWEWLAVDDHSRDKSPEILQALSKNDKRVRFFRLAKNEGAHIAIGAGLSEAVGKCAIVLASDCQDPPAEILRMLGYWKEGYQVIWLVRDVSNKENYKPGMFARIWYSIVKNLPGLESQPATGSDVFLVDRVALDTLRKHSIRKVSVHLLLRSLGFRQINIPFDKRTRHAGTSSWTLKGKLKHIMNTVIYFTNYPIRFVTVVGFSVSFVSASYAAFVFARRFWLEQSPTGWASTMFVTSLSLSLTMLLLGILGEYIWRTFESSRESAEFSIEFRSDLPELELTEVEREALEELRLLVHPDHRLLN
ncbi:glycosyltransferase family 2 protein [Calditrichota bacterium]